MDYQVGYIWSDGKIITQSLGLIVRGTSGGKPTETQINIDSKYVYEEGSNSPYAAMFSGSEYLFVKNAQGDVTAIVNSENGETIAEYQYDPWGQVTTVYGENTNDLEKAIVNAVCPLTYRGYNYDFTTGLYYLQSRYYSPEWGRFLNVDDVKILSTSAGDPLAANPYLYCSNNPVNRVDYTGKFEVTLEMFLSLFYMSVVPHMMYMLENERYLIPFGYGDNEYYDIRSIEVHFVNLYEYDLILWMNTPLGKTRVEARFGYRTVAEWKILVASKAYTNSALVAQKVDEFHEDFKLIFDMADYIPQPEISATIKMIDYVTTIYPKLFEKASSKKEKYIVSQLDRYHYPYNRGQPIVFTVLTSIYKKVMGKEQAVKAKKIIAYDR